MVKFPFYLFLLLILPVTALAQDSTTTSSVILEDTYYVGDHLTRNALDGTATYYFDNGYIQIPPQNQMAQPQYYYYTRDHLGNVRSVATKNPETNEVVEVQQTHYYPFGGIIADISWGREVQKRLFNGKELDTSSALYWYDYGARQYDATRGQFTGPDPLAEKYYPWNAWMYCGGDPVNRFDPDGRDWYRHDESGAVFWQEGNIPFVQLNGQTYRNIGETFSTYFWGVKMDFYQNNLTNVSESSEQYNVEGGQYIPDKFYTDDGTIVNVSFNYESPTGGNGKKSMDTQAVSLFIQGVNNANNNGSHITSIDVSCTTNGKHSSEKSRHYAKNGGKAIDIDNINGLRVINTKSSSLVDALQEGFKGVPSVRENIGPRIQEKNGIKYGKRIPGHNNHIHISTN